MRRRFTAEDIEIVRRDYGRLPASQIARGLGRQVWSVYNLAERLGLTRGGLNHKRSPAGEATLRQRHAEGWSDAEIAPEIGMTRRSAQAWRRALELASNAFSEHRRGKVREKTQEQLRKAGLPSIGHLRVEAFKRRAREAGWPEDLKPRQVEILNLLWDNGPMTREALGQAMGLKKKPRTTPHCRPWFAMHCNTTGHKCDTSYTGDLLRRGMIVTLGRVVKGRGQGGNVCMYSLPLNIQRGPVTIKERDDARAKAGDGDRGRGGADVGGDDARGGNEGAEAGGRGGDHREPGEGGQGGQ